MNVKSQSELDIALVDVKLVWTKITIFTNFIIKESRSGMGGNTFFNTNYKCIFSNNFILLLLQTSLINIYISLRAEIIFNKKINQNFLIL